MAALNERIKQCREKLKMSQAELAELLGYSDRSTIAKIEKGTNDITQSKIEAFAKALHTTPAYLMGWEDETGNQDIILTAIDVAKWLNTSREMVESVMEGMGWPDATNPEILSKISAEVERQKTLDQLADEINKQKYYLQTVADSTCNFFSEMRALVGIDKQTPHDIFFRDESEIVQMKEEIEDLIGKFMETATPEEKKDFLLRLDQIGEEFHRRMDNAKGNNN